MAADIGNQTDEVGDWNIESIPENIGFNRRCDNSCPGLVRYEWSVFRRWQVEITAGYFQLANQQLLPDDRVRGALREDTRQTAVHSAQIRNRLQPSMFEQRVAVIPRHLAGAILPERFADQREVLLAKWRRGVAVALLYRLAETSHLLAHHTRRHGQ